MQRDAKARAPNGKAAAGGGGSGKRTLDGTSAEERKAEAAAGGSGKRKLDGTSAEAAAGGAGSGKRPASDAPAEDKADDSKRKKKKLLSMVDGHVVITTPDAQDMEAMIDKFMCGHAEGLRKDMHDMKKTLEDIRASILSLDAWKDQFRAKLLDLLSIGHV